MLRGGRSRKVSELKNKKGVHTGLTTLSRAESVGTPLSGYEGSSPPLDQTLRLTLAGLLRISAMTVPAFDAIDCYIFNSCLRNAGKR